MQTQCTTELTKAIRYDRTTRDYSCFISIDGGPEQYIGSAPTYPAGEAKCRDFAFDFYADNHTPEKAARIIIDTAELVYQPGALVAATLDYCLAAAIDQAFGI